MLTPGTPRPWLRCKGYTLWGPIHVLNRTARSIPYARIQDVSIEQKPLARMMGLGEVKFETGGGDGDDAKLSFVTLEEANRLRALIRSRKAGMAVAAAADAPAPVEEDAHPIFAMDGKRVFVFGLYSFSLVIFAVLGGLAQQFDFLLPFDFWDFKHWIGLAEARGVSVNWSVVVAPGSSSFVFPNARSSRSGRWTEQSRSRTKSCTISRAEMRPLFVSCTLTWSDSVEGMRCAERLSCEYSKQL